MKLNLVLFLMLFQSVFGNSTKESSKNIDFEGEVVEGLNKQPLDSLEQISESERARKKTHLYKVRTEFRKEIEEITRELMGTFK